MHIVLTKNSVRREVKVGVSWTFFFFGWLVPLFRGQVTETLLIFFSSLLTFGLAHFYFMFKVNERYKNHLLENGWVLETPTGVAQ